MGAADGLVFLVMLAIGVAVYFLPLIIAVMRSHPNAGALAVLNLLLGWTLLGWVGALVWSLLSRPQQATDAQSQAIAEKYGVSAKYRKCPECAEVVLKEARKCKHCQSELEPVTE
jgi:hypothetical protein